jgi:hypothetical protein
MKIGIVLPVHENAEVVLDQVANIHRFIEDPQICLEVSTKLPDADYARLQEAQSTWQYEIDPYQFATTHLHSMVRLHISAFKHLQRTRQFDKYLICFSNELFIKPGIEAYIDTFDACCLQWNVDDDNTHTINDARQDTIYTGMRSGSWMTGTQSEGMSFSPWVFDKLATLFLDNYGWESPPYAQEELFYSTFITQYTRKLGMPTCFMEAHLTEAMIAGCLAGTYAPSHRCSAPDHVYSVKRIGRTMHDPLRTYIRSI